MRFSRLVVKNKVNHSLIKCRYILQQKVAALNNSPTVTQEALVQENRLVLGKRILNFRATQTHIMPEVALPPEDSDCDKPESISLHLPSELIGSCSFSLVVKPSQTWRHNCNLLRPLTL